MAGTIAVGEIVSAHALRGVVRVRPYQPPAPSLTAGRQVILEQDGKQRTATVVSVAPHGRTLLLVALRDIDDRDAAEALVGACLLVRAEDLPPPAADEFYYHEVEGFRVETTDGTPLGSIHETFSTGLNDVLVVRNADREYLIPVITDVIRAVDRDQRCIVIEPMPGLLE
ncbi:MAG TPA: ribosome maturation factor RimM [Candidatus Binatia bacterium]|nr:ribosome maturation factor RimM [Candidatus Binatia bacterium]